MDYFAAMYASRRAKIDDEIGGANGVFVMFDNHDRITDVAHSTQCFKQFFVVTLVQANAGFIENINYPGKFRAYLACQSYSLGLTPRE